MAADAWEIGRLDLAGYLGCLGIVARAEARYDAEDVTDRSAGSQNPEGAWNPGRFNRP
jgi:hypothetical protein